MTQDFPQILYDKGDYSKFLVQRMLRLYDQKLPDYNQEHPNVIYIYPEPVYPFASNADFFHKAWIKIIQFWKFEQVGTLFNRTSALVFSCKFAAYFQNTFSLGHPWVAASDCICIKLWKNYLLEFKLWKAAAIASKYSLGSYWFM